MIDYTEIKRHKRKLMLSDDFVSGHGRIESVEFHSYEYVYLKGVEDGMKAAGLDDIEVRRIVKMIG